jgi:hypothetical protein
MKTTLVGNTWGTDWAAGGEIGAAEEAAGGVIGAAWGTKVETRVVGDVCGAEVKARVIVTACGAGGVEVIG